MMAEYEIKLKDIEAAGSLEPEASIATAGPKSSPSRDWRDAKATTRAMLQHVRLCTRQSL